MPKETVKKDKQKAKTAKKTEKPNISQAGLMKALKTRNFTQGTDGSPYEFLEPKTNRKVVIHPDKVIVPGTNVSVPLGKGAITELMKQIGTL